MLSKALQAAAGNGQETGVVAEAVDFDGTNDYLQKTGITPSFGSAATFSCWFYYSNVVDACRPLFLYDSAGDSYIEYRINTSYDSSQSLDCRILNTAGSIRMAFYNDNNQFGQWIANGWNNLIVSFSIGSTVSVYLNDQPVSMTIWGGNAGGSTTINSARLVRDESGSTSGAMRLSNVFLDYTYRDLSIEANRRLFITADLKPALDQAALNPLIYLPMDDPTAVGANAGTAGDFTLTGTVARSGRGPNQYNVQYSTFNGSSDSLTRSTISGLADGKTFTLAFSCIANAVNERFVLWFNRDQSVGYFQAFKENLGGDSYRLKFEAFDSTDTKIMMCTTSTLTLNRNHNIVISADLSDTAKRHLYIDGAVYNGWSTYTNANIDFVPVSTKYYTFGEGPAGKYWSGTLGAVWFNTSYIDLSVADNLAKFVTGTGIDAKPVDLGATGELPTGTSPLIYLPMYGNNAGKNSGTGGNFTVLSGPYTGARGPNEFWGNKAVFAGAGTINRTSALTGVTAGKSFSASFYAAITVDSSIERIFGIHTAAAGTALWIYRNNSNGLSIQGYNSAGTLILSGATAALTSLQNGGSAYCQLSVDLTDTAKRYLYINGVSTAVTWSTYTNDTIQFSESKITFGGGSDLLASLDGKLAEFYFTTSYIDFSQEANRLKFRDCFGNPVNLTQQIEDAAIPNPAIYMRFPPTSFGTNYGTGGNFTVTGTITDGGQL